MFSASSFTYDISVNLPPGTYTATIFPPSDYLLSPLSDPQVVGNDFDPSTNTTVPVTLLSGESGVGSFDAGFYETVSISNQVFEDTNGNGIREPMENGYPGGMNITLYHSTNPNEPIASVVTDEDGNFIFPDLPPGEYELEFIPDDDSVTFSPQDVGTDDCTDSDVDPDTGRVSVTVVSGEDITCVNAGVAILPSIGPNVVFEDSNGNGLQDDNETGLPSVIVVLSHPNGTVATFDLTDANGEYSFPNLQPGEYYLSVNKEPGFVWSPVVEGGNQISEDANTLPYGNRSPTITLNFGDVDTTLDAGMYDPVTFSGIVWHDLDADGVKDTSEPTLEGIVVTLYDGNDAAVNSRSTDADGTWSFDGIPSGTYHAKITPPPEDSSGNAWMLSPNTDFDPQTWETTPTFFESGSTSEVVAGLYLPATIGEYVWFDEVPNGIQDGDEEPFDQPVTVRLYDELGNVVQETESNEAGQYQFTSVTPGSYSLEFLLLDAGNDTVHHDDTGPVTGRTGVTVVGEVENGDNDAGVMHLGLFYPDWTNDVQMCTNEGYDPAWMEMQSVNYLYKNKEECCEDFFWWRMTQCVGNEEFRFHSNGEHCETKIYFEDWEHNSPATWTDTTLFDTLEECCANLFFADYDGCIQRSPIMFKFEFCMDVQGLADPIDCQTADLYANVLEDTLNEGVPDAREMLGTRVDGTGEDPSYITPFDASITKIGNVSLTTVDGSTVCGGPSLGGQDFTNELTGTMPDIASAANSISNICGHIMVEDRVCSSEVCLDEHYNEIATELGNFIDSGNYTLALIRRATLRLPPVPPLQATSAIPGSFTTQNLLLPAYVTNP